MDKKYFENARTLFGTEGWEAFIAEVQTAVASIRIENINDEKSFWMAKGELIALARILGYENAVYALEADAEEPTDEEGYKVAYLK